MTASVPNDAASARRTVSSVACIGVRERDQRLAGICLICAHQWTKSETALEPAAARGALELWGCPNFEQARP